MMVLCTRTMRRVHESPVLCTRTMCHVHEYPVLCMNCIAYRFHHRNIVFLVYNKIDFSL